MNPYLPDRLSVYEGDPGFAPYEALGERRFAICILLDDVEQKNVLTADRSQGWIRRLVLIDGRPVIDGDHFRTEVVRGRVEFLFAKDIAA